MDPASIWGSRWLNSNQPIAKKYMETVCKKQSLVVLAADKKTMNELNKLIDDVGDYISALKTHVDLIDDWTREGWRDFVTKAKEKDLSLIHI